MKAKKSTAAERTEFISQDVTFTRLTFKTDDPRGLGFYIGSSSIFGKLATFLQEEKINTVAPPTLGSIGGYGSIGVYEGLFTYDDAFKIKKWLKDHKVQEDTSSEKIQIPEEYQK